MAQATKAAIKANFRTGYRPTEQNFADLIDSFVNKADDEVNIDPVTKNIGFGIVAPAQRADINGAIKIGNTTVDSPGAIRFNGADFEGYDGAAWKSLTLGSGGGGQWTEVGTMLNYNGTVGIGDAAPGAKLSLGSDVGNTKIAILKDGFGNAFGIGAQANQFRLHLNAPTSVFSFFNAPAGQEILTIQPNGSMGVNQPSPAMSVEASNVTPLRGGPAIGCSFGAANESFIYLNIPDTTISAPPRPLGDTNLIWKTGFALRFLTEDQKGVVAATTKKHLTIDASGITVEADVKYFGTISDISDARLKKDILPFEDGLSVINRIAPVKYRFKRNEGTDNDEEYVGVLAQDIQKIAPYAIKTHLDKSEDGEEQTEILSVVTGNFIFMLINAVKELEERVKKLEGGARKVSASKSK
ncbi:tail fiber domain-containing protein [Chitinophaga sp. MM2321]|uniref:tail fiber domain-containing protein n=1 Tax=Chitinophaga sp. MM2321 TaxID=3137178 RepID=UPI0032D59117